MNVEELRNMPRLRAGLKLVAGENGLDRHIRWIYFADCIQCVRDKKNPADYIHGEEVVIITNVTLTDNDDIVLGLIRSMNQKNIATVVVNEGQISTRVAQYCEQIRLPLFELSKDLHLIDLSQIVCQELMREETRVSSRERLFSEMLNLEDPDRSDILAQAEYLDVNLSGQFFVVDFFICDRATNEQMEEKKRRKDTGALPDEVYTLKSIVKDEFRPYVPRHMLVMEQRGHVLALVPQDIMSHDLLESVIDRICLAEEDRSGNIVKAGVGLPYEYPEEFRTSWKEAKDALKISRILSSDKKVFFYDSVGIYSVIMQIKSGRFMDKYVNAHLGRLFEADRLQGGDLVHTLEIYLECGANANDAAEKLFLHRNTMHYRLNKIRTILNNELSDLSTFLELELAFAFYRYRHQ